MWNDLSMRHLLAFRAVAEEGTFGRAAQRLGFTQSAVSQQVSALEKMVGQPLFDRPAGPRRPVITPAGDMLLVYARELIETVEMAEQDLDRFARGISGQLVIGTFQSVSARVVPRVMRLLHDEVISVEVTVIEDDPETDERLEQLLRGDIDLAFIVGDPRADLDARYLGADPHVAVVPADYPPGPVQLEDLSGKPMIGQPRDDLCGQIIERDLERLGVSPIYAFRSHDNGAVQSMVSAGVGVAVVPLLTVDTSDPTVSIRRTIPEISPRELSLVWPRGRTLSPVAQRFVDLTSKVCAELLAEAPSAPEAA